jgi:RsiW-degrading membrane proteinase PrsW (M82 family)
VTSLRLSAFGLSKRFVLPWPLAILVGIVAGSGFTVLVTLGYAYCGPAVYVAALGLVLLDRIIVWAKSLQGPLA